LLDNTIQPSTVYLLVCFQKFENKKYKTIILPLVLYGCETSSVTLVEEHRLRVFEKRVLRRIFGLKRDEVTGWWRKLHNQEFRDLYTSTCINKVTMSSMKRWAGM
jgi:hypothetical protein